MPVFYPRRTAFGTEVKAGAMSGIVSSESVLSPLRKGAFIPGYFLYESNLNLYRTFNGSFSKNKSAFCRHLLNHPLVVAFYETEQAGNMLQRLTQLNGIQPAINELGANLIIVTSEPWGSTIAEIKWINGLSLNFYFDPENVLAQKFGICKISDQNWQADETGGDTKVLPAIYVLDSVKRIIFDQVDQSFGSEIASAAILDAIRHSRLMS